MNPFLSERINKAAVGPSQQFRNLTLFPLLAKDISQPEYICMVDALADGQSVTITEVSSGGSVPNIMVTNGTGKKVLIMDGEELVGAKQNRVANTTILLDANSKTMIPVSCTEQGRWHANSQQFSHSKTVMAPKVRKKKLMSVSQSLKSSPEPCYASDQGEVWNEIAELHCMVDTESPTGAMHDAYAARSEDISAYKRHFEPVDKQFGVLAFIDGKPAGADMLSLGQAFRKNFDILLESYAMEALTSSKPDHETRPGTEEAELFLESLPALDESEFESVGLGSDCRYDGPEAVGAALMVDETPVHAAFFTRDSNRDRRRTKRNGQQSGQVPSNPFEASNNDSGSQRPQATSIFDDGQLDELRQQMLRELENEIQSPGKGADELTRLQEIYREMIRGRGFLDNGRNETN